MDRMEMEPWSRLSHSVGLEFLQATNILPHKATKPTVRPFRLQRTALWVEMSRWYVDRHMQSEMIKVVGYRVLEADGILIFVALRLLLVLKNCCSS